MVYVSIFLGNEKEISGFFWRDILPSIWCSQKTTNLKNRPDSFFCRGGTCRLPAILKFFWCFFPFFSRKWKRKFRNFSWHIIPLTYVFQKTTNHKNRPDSFFCRGGGHRKSLRFLMFFHTFPIFSGKWKLFSSKFLVLHSYLLPLYPNMHNRKKSNRQFFLQGGGTTKKSVFFPFFLFFRELKFFFSLKIFLRIP